MARDLNALIAAAQTRQEQAVDDSYGDVLVVLNARVDGLKGSQRALFLDDLRAFLEQGEGRDLTPATAINGAPALALAPGSPAPAAPADPLVDQARQLLQSLQGSRENISTTLKFVQDAIGVMQDQPRIGGLLTQAFQNLVAAAQNPHHPEARVRAWRLTDDGSSQPELVTMQNARSAAETAEDEARTATAALQQLVGYIRDSRLVELLRALGDNVTDGQVPIYAPDSGAQITEMSARLQQAIANAPSSRVRGTARRPRS